MVGYQDIPLVVGFNMITPTFNEVSGGEYSIQNVRLSDEAESYGWGTESIQIVNADGNVSATYTWTSPDMSGLEDFAWCDDSMQAVNVTIKQGQSFLLYTEGDGTATVAGAVATSTTGNYEVNLGIGFNGIGNAVPVAKNIQSIKLSDESESYGWGTESIQIVNTEGNVSATYTWTSPDMSGLETFAWCDDSMQAVDVTLQPGEGFLLYVEGEGKVTLQTAL